MYENKVFFKLKYDPRPIQIDCLNFTKQHINRGKKFIMLNLPTGSGKSFFTTMLINWYMNYINDDARFDILTNSKILQTQYTNDYNFIASLKGKNSYLCDTYGCSCQEGKELNKALKRSCTDCPYDAAFNSWMNNRVTLTNFHLFDTLHIYLPTVLNDRKKQNVLIIDEAHDFESVLCDYITMKISNRSLKLLGLTDANTSHVFNKIKDVKTLSQYRVFVDDFFIGYMDDVKLKHENKLSSNTLNQTEKVKVSKYITNLQSSIETYKNFITDTEVDGNINNWALDIDKEKENIFPFSYTIQPVWSHKYLEQYIWNRYDHVIFMSGTLLCKDMTCYINGVPNNLSCYHDVPSPFDVSKRPIYYVKNIGKMTFNDKHLTFENQKKIITKIIKKYPNSKGIIHTSNYELSKWLEDYVGGNSRFIFHTSENRDEALNKHINSKEPTILVSPSMISGVDLKDDLSRFQIILKMPYPSIQSNKIKKRQTDNQEWYNWKTVVDLIQSYGRSIRNENDYADTYILDDSFGNIMRFNHKYLPKYFTDAIKIVKFN